MDVEVINFVPMELKRSSNAFHPTLPLRFSSPPAEKVFKNLLSPPYGNHKLDTHHTVLRLR